MLDDMTPQEIKELVEAARFILNDKDSTSSKIPFNMSRGNPTRLMWHLLILAKRTPKDIDDAEILKLILNDEKLRMAVFNLTSKNKPWVWAGSLGYS